METKNISPKIYIPIAGAAIILGCLIGKHGPDFNNRPQEITQGQSRINEHSIEKILKIETNTIDDGFMHIYGITNENQDLAFYGWVI